MKRNLLDTFALLTLLFLLAGPFPAGAESLARGAFLAPTTFADVIEQVTPAVVHIVVKKTPKTTTGPTRGTDFFNDPVIADFFGEGVSVPQHPGEKRPHYANGSGFVIDAQGYILTNAHVVADADTITVLFPDKRSLSGTLIGSDPLSDVALIRVQGRNLPFAELGDSDALRVGDWALAIGSPLQTMQTVTAGIISATGRSSVGISAYEDFIQTDAVINPGNSGGPLFNIHGQVIGINTAFVTQAGGYMGVGFAIPINMARVIAQRLQEDGGMIRGWLGVTLRDVTPDMLVARNWPVDALHGAVVTRIDPDSPAAKSSLRQGDLILAFEGSAIKGAADLRNRVALSRPGSKASITHLHKGRQRTASIVLGTLQQE
ncbi:trypsin-like peptidase domain-containing protein [Desulfobulbus alkaliphilus]|uniref:trypsin-like peptidase domain-containing protein n=1 Tax=Desulfobulbus alkaliphilus TaxID=869814 RepID=UPI0019645F87|nr:trypsin-like peptidase domain-containing protein [Desulfobulbus alkaliphilus]MBM9535473.1 trypsin-like peptidase domain-containing protein [Desulfobulbus alkaliphilus]